MEMRSGFGVLEMAEVLDGISDVKDVPMPIPGYQWRKDQSTMRRLRLINNVVFASIGRLRVFRVPLLIVWPS